MVKKLFMVYLGICLSVITFGQISTNLQIVAKADNDLVIILQKNGIDFKVLPSSLKLNSIPKEILPQRF